MVAYAYNSGTQKLKQKITLKFEFEASLGYNMGSSCQNTKKGGIVGRWNSQRYSGLGENRYLRFRDLPET